ncbi:MAG: hypothetical protein DYG96_13335 [Chlorobi bacterium CHB2]|nr:hypothetical protein [Candidatus Kapabacteria bacterium]MCE7935554.1 hypothetical protein [Chlorobi bacterium CHB2]
MENAMNLKITLVPTVLLLAAALFSSSPAPQATTNSTATNTTVTMPSGCDITIKASNSGSRNLYVVLERSEVRSKQLVAGPWSSLDRKCPRDEMHVGPRTTELLSTTCELDLTCSLQRQYKFLIQEKNDGRVINTAWVYFPSDNSWTASNTRTINLGDVSRHF